MRRKVFVGVRIIVFGIVAITIVGLITTMLWNALIPDLLRLPAITFWQALGLLLLSRLFFGRFNGMGHRMRKARFARGLKDLTPEELHRFRQALHPEPPPQS